MNSQISAREGVLHTGALDDTVTSIEDAIVLDCLDRVGQITYREALDARNARLNAYKSVINGILGIEIK